MGMVKQGDKVILDGCEVCDWDEMCRCYQHRIEQHGLSYKAYFYSKESLYTERLASSGRVLHQVVGAGDSVLDVGCGTGNLVPLLPPCRYAGVDIMPQFIEEAQLRYPHLPFTCANVMELEDSFDWVLLVGTSGTTPQLEKVVSKCFSLATKGVVLDVLDADRDPGGDRNSCYAGAAVEFLISLGATRVEVAPTRAAWTFVTAYKEPFWL